MAGQVNDDLRQSAAVARAFIRLHSEWITDWLDKDPVRDPDTANIRMHLSTASVAKDGESAGAAFCGE